MDRKAVARKNKLDKIIKNSKKRQSQMDIETPGGFVKSTEEEEQLIIEGKIKDRIIIQENLRSAEIAQQYSWAEANELEQIHKNYDKKSTIKPKWYGIDMPKKILVCEYNTKVQIWKNTMTKRNQLYKQLKNVGFTEKQFEPLLVDGKIISDHDLLKKLEADYEKKQLEKKDVDSV